MIIISSVFLGLAIGSILLSLCLIDDIKEFINNKEFVKKYKYELENRYFKFESRYYLFQNINGCYILNSYCNFLELIYKKYLYFGGCGSGLLVCVYKDNCLFSLNDKFNYSEILRCFKYEDRIYKFDEDIKEYVKQL